jgi:TatD DNase family protein
MVHKHPGFVYAVGGIHPEYVGRFDQNAIDAAIATLLANRENLVGIGETGLDYAFITGKQERKMQQEMFIRFIRLAQELGKPMVVHLRNGEDGKDEGGDDVFDDAFEILKKEKAKNVQLHMFGCKRLVEDAIAEGWYISTNAIVLHSKTYGKVVRDTPLKRLMLETDAPWLHPSLDKEKRNDPTHVREVAERIAEIKNIDVATVVEVTTDNAISFFGLK